MARTRPRRVAERAAAWVITGPLGRLYSTLVEVAAYWRARARERVRR